MEGITELEIELKELEAAIDKKNDLQKLLDMPLFQKAIGVNYIEEESVRLVGLLGEENLDDAKKANVHKMILGVAYFQEFLRRTYNEGAEAEMIIEENRKALNEASAEVN